MSPNEKSTGSFGEPIRRSVGSTWTHREYRALKKTAGFGSMAKAIRSLIHVERLEQLIRDSEANARQSTDGQA